MTLHVETFGRGPDLALVHGWGLHGGVWSGLADRLGGRFRVHAVDLPGHGHSGAARFGDLDALADMLAAALPAGALVCGWSLGALVAMRLAGRHPRQARALALVSATPCFVERPDWPHAMARSTLEDFAAGLRDEPRETLARFVRLNALGGAASREAIRSLMRALEGRPAPRRDALEDGLALLRESDLRAEASRLAQPAALLHGRRDRLVPVESARWLAARVPAARLVEIESGHLPFLGEPEAFMQLLEGLRG